MDLILYVTIGFICLNVGVNILRSQERNKVFNKRPIEVSDVKKYNRLCGILVLGFGVTAEITLFFMCNTVGWTSILFTLLIIFEALLVAVIYNQIEKKLLKKR